jgi:hypothetical protein
MKTSRLLPAVFIGLVLPGLAYPCGDDMGGCDYSRDLRDLRAHPEFLYSEERQRGPTLWLHYETDAAIPACALGRYAEHRSRLLCGGDFRYLSNSEYPVASAGGETARERRIEVVVECLS